MGRPGGGLFDGGNPDKQLLWCIGFLAMVGGLSNAICRERDGRREAEFASRMPGFCEAVWPLSERRVLLESLKRWSAHGRAALPVVCDSPRALPARLANTHVVIQTLWRGDPLAQRPFGLELLRP
jgi:hypothetical protein